MFFGLPVVFRDPEPISCCRVRMRLRLSEPFSDTDSMGAVTRKDQRKSLLRDAEMKKVRTIRIIAVSIVSLICFLSAGCFHFACAAGTLTLPKGLKTIPQDMFLNDRSVSTVVIQKGTVSIESNAFYCSGLKVITIPSSVTYIAEDAFTGCTLKTVYAEEGSYAYQWMRERGKIREYRALLIGVEEQRNLNDVYRLRDRLGNTKGSEEPYGPTAGAFHITIMTTKNRPVTYTRIKNSIESTFQDTMDQDLSVFFIATHGTENGLALSDGDTLPFETLATWLKENVKGKVVVIIQSCHAGYFLNTSIITGGFGAVEGEGEQPEELDGEIFVRQATEAFRAADPGVPVELSLFGGSTVEVTEPKFYVLVACTQEELSYGAEHPDSSKDYNFFTQWLINGIGTKGHSPADKNKDNALSLSELYNYIKTPRTYNGEYIDQHVQCYPTGNTDILLKLK